MIGIQSPGSLADNSVTRIIHAATLTRSASEDVKKPSLAGASGWYDDTLLTFFAGVGIIRTKARSRAQRLRRRDLVSLALLALQPGVGFIVADEDLLHGVPGQLASQTDRDVGEMAGRDDPVL